MYISSHGPHCRDDVNDIFG